MAEKKSFNLYKSWEPMIQAMQTDAAGLLFKAIYTYQTTGEEPPTGASFYPMFTLFKAKFDEDDKEYIKKCDEMKRLAEDRESKRNTTKRKRTVTNRKRTVTNEEHTVTDTDTDTVTDTDTENENDTVTDKQNPRRTQAQVVEESDLSDPTKPVVIEWLKYKHERRFTYKETSLQTLIKQVRQKELDYGQNYVRECIETSISSGYQGIVWKEQRASPQKGTNWDAV